MNSPRDKVKAVFDRALDIDSLDEREQFVQHECGDDPEVLAKVEALLSAYAEAGSFLEAQPVEISPTVELPVAEQPGTQIGPYKLLQEIGHGGMGVVFMAEQEEPVERRVALKIIKPGMDTRQVIARFEAERQALALMDHPNIAKVLDAASTDSGRPYFVMELVKGVPITQYCDDKHLTPKERLELFIPVCQAVQHAHQKGIIHRDLKPSNVLVAQYDGRPVPKVIDFGVAKATTQKLTEKTMFTQFGQIVGTLEYMSPEQAEVNQLDIDTRSDVYSLGVLLYELLTGATPFDRARLRAAAFDEMLRIIREEEPPRPSMRLSTIATLPSVAANRRMEPQRLRTLVRGELDWIVMKALEKDRSRRYETANGLAADVQRHLQNETVAACPPSTAYRFRKFIRRNKASLITVAAIGVILMLATAVSISQAVVAQRAEEQARNSLAELRTEIVNKVFRYMMQGDEVKAQAAITQAQEAEVPENLIGFLNGQLALYFGRPDEALVLLQEPAQESVAALAMLHMAHFFSQSTGQLAVMEDLRTRLEGSAGALTFEDRLFAGQAMVNDDMVFGIELVEQALNELDSPLARLIHAQTLTAYAHNTGETEKMEQALEQLNAATPWLGNAPILLGIQHMVQHVGLVLGVSEASEISEDKLLEDWETIKEIPAGRMGLIRFLADVNLESAVGCIESVPHFESAELLYYIPILLNARTPAEVLSFLANADYAPDPFVDCSKTRVMALIPEQRHKARKRCRSLIEEHSTFWIRTSCLHNLLLLGDVQDVRTLSAELMSSTTEADWYSDKVMEYYAAPDNPEEFVAGANVLVERHQAFFAVAMYQLAQGERQEAVESLGGCIVTKAFHSEDYYWARAFVKAIGNEPLWKLEVD